MSVTPEDPGGGLPTTHWTTIPLALVVVLLLGSVLIPARQTWRITTLLREATDIIEPARLDAARLEFGLIAEGAALEQFVLTGDRAQWSRYLAAATDDNRRVARLQRLARGLDPEAIERAATVQSRIGEWRELSRALLGDSVPRSQLAAAMRADQASLDAALQAVGRLATYLSAEENARRDLIGGSERFGLLVNAGLVLAALAAVLGVAALSYRERRLTRIIRRRMEEESALAGATRELAAATTAADVMRHLAYGASATTHAAGAYAEHLVPDGDTVEYVSYQRGNPAMRCVRVPRAGSLTEAITKPEGPEVLTQIDAIQGWTALDELPAGRLRSGIVVPLSSSHRTLGALAIFQDGAPAAAAGDARRLHILADLASAALNRLIVQSAERQALEAATQRAKEEVALREAAEALAAAFTMDQVTQQIARTALEATQAAGAFVEQIVAATDEERDLAVVRAAAGEGVPVVGSGTPFAGSCTESVVDGRESVLITELTRTARPCLATAAAGDGCSVIAVPLWYGEAPFGALFVVSARGVPFSSDDLTRADTFGHLAALAYEKVRLLDESAANGAELSRVISSRSRLMRGFSHDVKNPLGAAEGYASLLSDGIFGPIELAQAGAIERIRASIHTALALIDDLHEFGRAETGNIILSLEPVDLAHLVQGAGEEYRAAADARALSLVVELGRAPFIVQTDGTRVRQIVGNLISNAIKYTEQGSVTVRAHRQPDPTGDSQEWGVIEVCDTGRGIPTEKLDAIFEEFIRVAADETSGAGLGLAISQKLALALGGRITVRSRVGQGSTFTLWLPLGAEQPAPSQV